jgi:hypothetical protein
MSALKFIQSVARKLLVPKGKGITSIANRMQAEAKAGEIAETFRLSGLTPDKWDDFIKSEADVKKYLNIIESMKKQSITRKFGKTTDERFDSLAKYLEKRDTLFGPEKADVLDLTGKKIDTSKPILGGKNVPETEEQILQRLNRQNKESVERLKNKKLEDPEDLAYGGVAGMLGEPTYADGGRTGFQGGALAAYQQGQKQIMTGAPPEQYDVSQYEAKGYSPGDLDFLRRTQIPTEAPDWFLKEQEMQKQYWDPSLGAFEPGESWEDMEEGAKVHMMRELGPYHELEYANPNASMMSPVGPVGPGPSEQEAKAQSQMWEDTVKKATPQEHLSMGLHAGPGITSVATSQEPVTRNPLVDPRMYRSYEENKQLMGDPRMRGAQGGRAGFGKGKLVDVARRKFLQMVGAGAAGVGVAKSGLLGLLKGGGKKAVIKDLTSVPINNIDGMPVWFKPLVNKVIKEGDDVTKKFATADREIVHQVSIEGKIGKDALGVEDVRVTQNLDEGTIRVEYNSPNTIGESGVDLLYKKGEVIPTKKGSVKTKDEFTASEDDFYPQQTSPDDFDIEVTENIVNKVDDLYSDTSKLKEFATGKKLTIKEISESMKKKNILKEIENNPNEHAFRNVPDEPPYDYASGGRVPLRGGKLVLEGLEALMKKFFPGTTKIGQTSKPMAPKTELKRAIAAFQEREKASKLKIWEDKTKVRAAVDDIFPTGDYKYDAEMAAEALVENNPKAFGGKLIDDIDDATRSDIYGSVLRVITNDMAKLREMRKLSKPTKTLAGIKKTGTVNISDPNVADEFSRFMKESDPKGFKDLEQKVDLSNLDIKGKKGHASGGRVSLSAGGLAGMLGE